MAKSKRVEVYRRLSRSKRNCAAHTGTKRSRRSKRAGCPKGPRRTKRCGHTTYKRHHMGQRGGYVCGGRHNNREQRGGQSCRRPQQSGGTACHCNGTGKPHAHNKRVRGRPGIYKKRNMGPAPRIQ